MDNDNKNNDDDDELQSVQVRIVPAPGRRPLRLHVVVNFHVLDVTLRFTDFVCGPFGRNASSSFRGTPFFLPNRFGRPPGNPTVAFFRQRPATSAAWATRRTKSVKRKGPHHGHLPSRRNFDLFATTFRSISRRRGTQLHRAPVSPSTKEAPTALYATRRIPRMGDAGRADRIARSRGFVMREGAFGPHGNGNRGSTRPATGNTNRSQRTLREGAPR